MSQVGSPITTEDRGMLAKARMDNWARKCSQLLDQLSATPADGEGAPSTFFSTLLLEPRNLMLFTPRPLRACSGRVWIVVLGHNFGAGRISPSAADCRRLAVRSDLAPVVARRPRESKLFPPGEPRVLGRRLVVSAGGSGGRRIRIREYECLVLYGSAVSSTPRRTAVGEGQRTPIRPLSALVKRLPRAALLTGLTRIRLRSTVSSV